MDRQKVKFDYDRPNNEVNITELFGKSNSCSIHQIIQTISKLNISLAVRNKDYETLIHQIINYENNTVSESKKCDFIEFCIINGVDLEAHNRYGITALHLACKYQYKKIAKLLLKYGANPNTIDSNHMTPLHYLFQGKIDTIKKDKKYQDNIKSDFYKLCSEIIDKMNADPYNKIFDTISDIVGHIPIIFGNEFNMLDHNIKMNKFKKLTDDEIFEFHKSIIKDFTDIISSEFMVPVFDEDDFDSYLESRNENPGYRSTKEYLKYYYETKLNEISDDKELDKILNEAKIIIANIISDFNREYINSASRIMDNMYNLEIMLVHMGVMYNFNYMGHNIPPPQNFLYGDNKYIYRVKDICLTNINFYNPDNYPDNYVNMSNIYMFPKNIIYDLDTGNKNYIYYYPDIYIYSKIIINFIQKHNGGRDYVDLSTFFESILDAIIGGGGNILRDDKIEIIEILKRINGETKSKIIINIYDNIYDFIMRTYNYFNIDDDGAAYLVDEKNSAKLKKVIGDFISDKYEMDIYLNLFEKYRNRGPTFIFSVLSDIVEIIYIHFNIIVSLFLITNYNLFNIYEKIFIIYIHLYNIYFLIGYAIMYEFPIIDIQLSQMYKNIEEYNMYLDNHLNVIYNDTLQIFMQFKHKITNLIDKLNSIVSYINKLIHIVVSKSGLILLNKLGEINKFLLTSPSNIHDSPYFLSNISAFDLFDSDIHHFMINNYKNTTDNFMDDIIFHHNITIGIINTKYVENIFAKDTLFIPNTFFNPNILVGRISVSDEPLNDKTKRYSLFRNILNLYILKIKKYIIEEYKSDDIITIRLIDKIINNFINISLNTIYQKIFTDIDIDYATMSHLHICDESDKFYDTYYDKLCDTHLAGYLIDSNIHNKKNIIYDDAYSIFNNGDIKIYNADIELTKMMIDGRSDININNKNGLSPIYHLISILDYDTLLYLINIPSLRINNTALHSTPKEYCQNLLDIDDNAYEFMNYSKNSYDKLLKNINNNLTNIKIPTFFGNIFLVLLTMYILFLDNQIDLNAGNIITIKINEANLRAANINYKDSMDDNMTTIEGIFSNDHRVKNSIDSYKRKINIGNIMNTLTELDGLVLSFDEKNEEKTRINIFVQILAHILSVFILSPFFKTIAIIIYRKIGAANGFNDDNYDSIIIPVILHIFNIESLNTKYNSSDMHIGDYLENKIEDYLNNNLEDHYNKDVHYYDYINKNYIENMRDLIILTVDEMKIFIDNFNSYLFNNDKFKKIINLLP